MPETAAALSRRILFRVHSGLPREAPGSRESTARALAMVPDLPPAPRVLDIGCGPGMQTLDLAGLLPAAELVGVDTHEDYIVEASRRAAEQACSDRVRFMVGDMRSLPFGPARFDLLWSEGAAYIMGVAAALRAWRPLLREGGCLAFTDAVWLTDDAPETLRAWWQTEYPAMCTRKGSLERLSEAGYELRGEFILPESAWWDDYYRPMEARLAGLRVEMEGEARALAVLEAHQREIDCYRRWSAHYGYQFVVARKAD